MPPVSLIGYQAVVSIEPDPDDSPGPFSVEAAGGHEHSRRWAGSFDGQHGTNMAVALLHGRVRILMSVAFRCGGITTRVLRPGLCASIRLLS